MEKLKQSKENLDNQITKLIVDFQKENPDFIVANVDIQSKWYSDGIRRDVLTSIKAFSTIELK